MTLPPSAPSAPAADEQLVTTANSLPAGTRLAEFELRGVLGEGGFATVYRAHDHSLRRTVAIKEYMPGALATRAPDGSVIAREPQMQATLARGLHSFLNEARLLAQFDHPALIRVYRFWEQNGTAYMAMQLCQGRTLRALRQAEPRLVASEPWLKHMLSPILDALELLHANDCYHRDISPDNIMVLDSGVPMLLDFGAARQAMGDATQALTVIVKPGFAPIEQYDSVLEQGPWTDVYSLGAVLHFLVTGQPVTASVSRLLKDPLPRLADTPGLALSPAFARAIDRALTVHPEDRIRGIAEFREALELPTFWAEMQRQSVELGALRSHSGTTGFGALAELGDDDAAPSDLGPATLPPPEERAMPAAAPRRPRPDAAERARTPAERPRPPAPATRSGTPPAPHAAGAAARPAARCAHAGRRRSGRGQRAGAAGPGRLAPGQRCAGAAPRLARHGGAQHCDGDHAAGRCPGRRNACARAGRCRHRRRAPAPRHRALGRGVRRRADAGPDAAAQAALAATGPAHHRSAQHRPAEPYRNHYHRSGERRAASPSVRVKPRPGPQQGDGHMLRRSVLCWGTLGPLTLLGGCATVRDKLGIGQAPQPAPARRPAEAPRARPAPPAAPAPAPAPEAATPPADEPAPPTGEAVYAEGLRLYRAGRYDEAIARFAAVQAPTALRVQALKHTAFSYCVTNRLPSCQRAFQDALALAPGFRLSKAERGHPVWGPVFDKALLQSQPARRRR